MINVLTEKCLTNTSPVSVVDCSSAPPYWTLDSVKGGLYVTGTSSGLHAKSGGISGSAWDGDVVNTMAITVSSPYTNEMWSSVSTC